MNEQRQEWDTDPELARLAPEKLKEIITKHGPMHRVESFKKFPIDYRGWHPGEERVYSLLAPRRYSGLGNYDEPSAVGRHLASLVANVMHVRAKYAESNEGSLRDQLLHVADRLVMWKVPTYYIGENLFEALVRTDLPRDVTPADFNWPVPAMMLMVPLGKLGTSKFNYTTLLLTKHSDEYTSPITGDHVPLHDAPFMRVIAIGPARTMSGDASYAIVQSMSPMDRTVAETKQFKLERMDNLTTGEVIKDRQSLSEADVLSDIIFEFALKLLMVMNARPELLEKEPGLDRPERKNKRTGKVERDALWSPNFLGRHYQRPRKPSEGTGQGGQKRVHLRRAHGRWQAHGPNHTLRKWMWIEECWINLDEEL